MTFNTGVDVLLFEPPTQLVQRSNRSQVNIAEDKLMMTSTDGLYSMSLSFDLPLSYTYYQFISQLECALLLIDSYIGQPHNLPAQLCRLK